MGNSESLQVLSASSDLLTESSPERGITTKEMVRHDYPTNDKLQRKLYHGQWENGKRNGKGTLEWRNGAVYEGNWENDALCGLGSFLLPAGIRYEGEFKDNQFHGNGVLSWLSGGRRYEGSWKDSKHHGFGVLYFAEDDARVRRFYRGEWEDGKRHGYGIMEWQTGARYEGQWVEGKREGKGKQLFANGDVSPIDPFSPRAIFLLLYFFRRTLVTGSPLNDMDQAVDYLKMVISLLAHGKTISVMDCVNITTLMDE